MANPAPQLAAQSTTYPRNPSTVPWICAADLVGPFRDHSYVDRVARAPGLDGGGAMDTPDVDWGDASRVAH